MKCRKRWCRKQSIDKHGSVEGWQRGFCPNHAQTQQSRLESENWVVILSPHWNGMNVSIQNKHHDRHPKDIDIPAPFFDAITEFAKALRANAITTSNKCDPMDTFVAPDIKAGDRCQW